MANDALRARVLALVRAHGYDTTSFQVLGDGFQYFFAAPDACVAYLDTGSAWVAAGAPLAPAERLAAVVALFVDAAQRAHRRPLLFATEARFVEAVPAFAWLRVGEQPVWNPQIWKSTKARTPSLREQLRRARAKGIRVVLVPPAELAPGTATRAAAERIVARWRSARPLAPMGFLVRVAPFTELHERRHYLAFRGEALVGLVSLAPVYARAGFFFEHLLRDPAAPNGTTELLFDRAMQDLATEGVAHATLGLSPLAGDVPRWLRFARGAGRPLYDFTGLAAFKKKLRPAHAEPVFVSLPPDACPLLGIYDVLRAFAGQRLFSFGLATLMRGPDVAIRALSLLLLPWTTSLALASPAWFPGPLVQWGWVGFDLVLAVLLFRLARRFNDLLALLLASAVSLDAAVTLVEAVVWNAARLSGWVDGLVVVGAVGAPTLAAVVLWRARGRHRRLDEPGVPSAALPPDTFRGPR